MSVHIAVDPGSCHMGKKAYAKELIKVAKECGADSIKFQLFRAKDYPDNIELNRDLFLELLSYGKSIEMLVTASAFDIDALALLMRVDVPYYKFAYSKSQDLSNIFGLLNTGKKVVVTTDVMRVGDFYKHPETITLFVDNINGKSVYPVPWWTSFEGLFPLFHGYSDHHKGYGIALEAVAAGARWIEKHFMLPYSDCQMCPDGRFSILPADLEVFCRKAKG